jgi:hypothetical protein
MTVLDVCACPGSKSFGAAINMKNSGAVHSFDLHAKKLSLVKSGAMTKKMFSANNQRPCYRLSVSQDLNIMVIDLSMPKYRMSIISGSLLCLFTAEHTYISDCSFEENLNIFLSRCGLKAKQSLFPFNAICVMYRDPNQSAVETFQAHIPSFDDKVKIDRAIFSVFRQLPTLHTTVSKAIASAVRYRLIPSSNFAYGVSYIFVGSYASAFNISADSHITVCNVPKLVIDEVPIKKLLPADLSKRDFDKLSIRLINFMSAAFAANSVIVESDTFVFDKDSMSDLAKFYAGYGEFAPTIFPSSSNPSISTLGAARETAYLVIKSFLQASNE